MVLPLWALDPAFWLHVLVPCAGLGLFVRGLRGRREGSEPYCRRCSYNLTGIELRRCPECGSELSAKAIELGKRRRFPRQLALGAALLFVAAGRGGQLAWDKFNQINWWNYRPFGWVRKDAEAGTLQAASELERRVRWNRLSAEQLHDLQHSALSIVCAERFSSNFKAWFAVLKKIAGSELLTGDDLIWLATTAFVRGSSQPPYPDHPYSREWVDVLEALREAGRLSEHEIDVLRHLRLCERPDPDKVGCFP